jgi:hypothetical protein
MSAEEDYSEHVPVVTIKKDDKSYSGPCPRCNTRITGVPIIDDKIICPHCN